MTLRIRTKADNRQLAEGETQFESVEGAVSAQRAENSCVRITCVRGIPSRKANFATLDAKALAAFISHLQALQKRVRERPMAPAIPDCTCSVAMCTTYCLPGCPRGLATGRRYATQAEVPDDVLKVDEYTERHGQPPPVCNDCGDRLYDSDGPGCRACRVSKYWDEQRQQVEKEPDPF